MNSFWESFISIFNLFPSSKTYDETTENLDRKMQDLYDRMGWGKYNSPTKAFSTSTDINRVLEAEKQFNNAVDNYLYRTKQQMITYYDYNPITRDPARKRINKYY